MDSKINEAELLNEFGDKAESLQFYVRLASFHGEVDLERKSEYKYAISLFNHCHFWQLIPFVTLTS